MKYVFCKNNIIFSLAWAVLVSCTQPNGSGTYKVTIPVDDGDNHYTLQERELHTVTDLNAMAGTAAVFKADGRFNTNVDSSGQERFESAEHGTTPSAHFLNAGDIYHPSDFASLSMTTAMYHFENIKAFYDGFGATKELTFPREVLVNVTLSRHNGEHQSETINNASYVNELDLFLINPYKAEDVPLTINGGVLAHEYLHSIFMRKVSLAAFSHYKAGKLSEIKLMDFNKFAKTTNQINEWIGLQDTKAQLKQFAASDNNGDSKMSASDLKAANSFLFASINEGVADYYAYEYTHNAKWIVASLPGEDLRVLNLPKVFSPSAAAQKKRFVLAAKANGGSDALDVHGVGAYFSHFLWLTSAAWGPDTAKKAALDFMENYAEQLVVHSDDKFISMGDLVRLYFKGHAPGASLCDSVHKMFPNELDATQFSCDGLTIVNGGTH